MKKGTQVSSPPVINSPSVMLDKNDRFQYNTHTKFTRNLKPPPKKEKPIEASDVDNEFLQVESILASKNINYGYGDSKNREKVLKFITDMKNKQT